MRHRMGLDYFLPWTELLRIYSLWPRENEELNILKPFYYRCAAVYLLFATPMTIAILSHFFKYVSISPIGVLEDLVLFFLWSSVCAMLTVIMIRAETLANLMNDFYIYYPPGNSLEQIKSEKKKSVYLFHISMIISTLCFGIYKIWDESNCKKRKGIQKVDESCGFVLPIWMPFNYDFYPAKQIINLLQLIELLLLIPPITTFAYLLFHLIDETVNSFNFLDTIVAQMRLKKRTHEKRQLLIKFIEYHNVLIKIVDDLNYVTSIINLIYCSFSAIVTAILCYLFIEVFSVSSVIVMVIWNICVISLVINAQNIINKSDDLNHAIYNIPWYRMDRDLRYLMLVIIMRTQKPLSLNIAGICPLSASIVVKIFNATVSFVAFFLQISRTGMQTH